MNKLLKIEEGVFGNLVEIWGVSSNTVEVVTKDGQHFRITAAEDLRPGAVARYAAKYEQRYAVKIGSQDLELWGPTSFPWQVGATVEACLRPALGWVNEQYSGKKK
ncbi:hypothetical protein LZ198_41395 [Myxococcus sp. K15C18031901]|uniref:hypothetical protein n=1 Tax=Myxococcus dinghuensis TaxID=2906761 RepID=UPI0020A7D695|nr:hypothetical protein [Myxococcus dinghuensis]MCP3105341.1 hypothetical protein [Myxococcus dinghuensis]